MENDTRECWILDCDTGVDDTFAIFLLLGNLDKINLLGITTANGNTTLDNVVKNTLICLEMANKEIDVYVGCEEPLVNEVLFVEHRFHGADGLGEVAEFKELKGFTQCLKKEHAVEAILRLANEYSGRLNILAIGPLTNIALAAKLDPSFNSKIKQLVFMGGAHYGQGNVNCNGEHNVYSDPESYKICMDELAEKMVVVTWECTYVHEFEPEEYPELFNKDKKACRFLDKMTAQVRKEYGKLPAMCDLMAAAIALDPTLIKKEIITHCDVERSSPECRGQTLILWPNNYYFRKIRREELAKLKKIKIVLESDIYGTRKMFLNALKNLE
jgi:purine nucleosidase